MNRLTMMLMGMTLMNEAPVDGAPSGGADPAPADAAPATDTTLLTTPQTPPAADPKPESGKQDPEGDAKPKDEGKPKGAPEAYTDFTLPEGFEMDGAVLDEFKGIAKDLGISQEAAQKLVDLQSKLATQQAAQAQEVMVQQRQQWADAVRADPEIGGDKYDASVATAVKVVQFINDPQLTQLLNDSGLGNHPSLVKAFVKIGKSMSDDAFVLPGSQVAPKEMSIVDAFR
ncbi:hypothetical protein D9M71_116910 [compost metagenome]